MRGALRRCVGPSPLLAAAVLLALSSDARAVDQPSGLPPERSRAIDVFVGLFTELAMFDGTVLVDVAGKVVYERSFGYAHEEMAVRHGPETKFRIASVSKLLTDAAFAVLIQRGVLGLDTPVARYLPDFPAGEAITIGHLLSHRSGIAHTNDQAWGDGSTSLTLDQIVERLASLPLDFDPGTETSYSNGGYAVAAKILEVAEGDSFSEVMRSTVFRPLAMNATDHIADSRQVIPGLATGYEPGLFPGERRHARFYAVETRPGGGSLYSTVGDLLRFARGTFRDGFLEPRLLREVLGVDESGLLSQGRSSGFVAKLLYDPAGDVIVISLANSYAVPADWARTIADLATGKLEAAGWPELCRGSNLVGADDPRLGRYRNSRGGGVVVIERSARGAMVLADPAHDSVTSLVPLADGSFLQPLYFQRCVQEAVSRVITCGILSGDPRYTSELTPVSAGGDVTPERPGRSAVGEE